jgi:hypothetical protein
LDNWTRKQKIAFAVTAVALLTAVTVAWSLQVSSEVDGGGYAVDVVRDGAVLETFDVEALAALGMRKVVTQGQQQEGPPLLAVLGAAGVTDFDSVTVTGLGVRDDGRIVLSRAQVDQDVVLDVAERGTTKLCGPNIAYEDRVRDVERIEVR